MPVLLVVVTEGAEEALRLSLSTCPFSIKPDQTLDCYRLCATVPNDVFRYPEEA